MLKELLQYMKEHNRAETVEAAGRLYSTRELHPLDLAKSVNSIRVRSLTGLVSYVQSNFDTAKKFMIHIESPTSVLVYDALDRDNKRQSYLKANALLPDITFDRSMQMESFIIQTQAKFIQDENTHNLLKFVGSISEENSRETKDNGVSQSVVAKVGVATVEEVKVPNPLTLRPFRTFVEVPQPSSDFILRLNPGPTAALYEADGGSWEINAMHNVREYLDKELSKEIASGKVIIIS